MTTQLDGEETASARARSVASPATGEPVRLFSRGWFAGLALRYAMVLVMLLVIAYFSYRSARFSTVDNLVTLHFMYGPRCHERAHSRKRMWRPLLQAVVFQPGVTALQLRRWSAR